MTNEYERYEIQTLLNGEWGPTYPLDLATQSAAKTLDDAVALVARLQERNIRSRVVHLRTRIVTKVLKSFTVASDV